jgi:5-aminolevulinate synthase
MPCPFLTRLPSTYVRNYATALMKQYAEQCPYLSKRGITSSSSFIQDHIVPNAGTSTTCPFLKEMDATSQQVVVKKVSSLQAVKVSSRSGSVSTWT